MTRILGTALALAAGLALAARPAQAADAQQKARKEAARHHKGEATRHLVTSQVALEQARLGLQGLYALLADTDGAFDAGHARTLIEVSQRGVKLAAGHLQHLTMVPAEDSECRLHLTKVQTSLGRVMMELQALDGAVAGGGAAGRDSGGDSGLQGAEQHDAIKQVEARFDAMKKQAKVAWKSLDEAGSDFKRVADDYKVSVRLPTP